MQAVVAPVKPWSFEGSCLFTTVKQYCYGLGEVRLFNLILATLPFGCFNAAFNTRQYLGCDCLETSEGATCASLHLPTADALSY